MLLVNATATHVMQEHTQWKSGRHAAQHVRLERTRVHKGRHSVLCAHQDTSQQVGKRNARNVNRVLWLCSTEAQNVFRAIVIRLRISNGQIVFVTKVGISYR